MFLVSLRLPKDEFVQVIAFLFVVCGAPLYLTLIANGLLTLDKAAASLVAALPALAGVGLGRQFRGRIRQETFNRFLLLLLFIIGLNLLRRGVLRPPGQRLRRTFARAATARRPATTRAPARTPLD